MPADVKALAINSAANDVIGIVRALRDVSSKIITPITFDSVSGDPIFMHASSVAILKSDAAGLKAAWNAVKAQLDTAFTVS